MNYTALTIWGRLIIGGDYCEEINLSGISVVNMP